MKMQMFVILQHKSDRLLRESTKKYIFSRICRIADTIRMPFDEKEKKRIFFRAICLKVNKGML